MLPVQFFEGVYKRNYESKNVRVERDELVHTFVCTVFLHPLFCNQNGFERIFRLTISRRCRQIQTCRTIKSDYCTAADLPYGLRMSYWINDKTPCHEISGIEVSSPLVEQSLDHLTVSRRKVGMIKRRGLF